MLDRLPDEVLYLVLEHFGSAEELENVSFTCSKLRRVCLDNRLWRRLFEPLVVEGAYDEWERIDDYRMEYYKQISVDKTLWSLLRDRDQRGKVGLAVEVSRYDRRAFRVLNEAIMAHDEDEGFLAQIKSGIIHMHGFQTMLDIKQRKSNDVVDLMLALDKFWIHGACVTTQLNAVITELQREDVDKCSLETKSRLISKKLLQWSLLSRNYNQRWHGCFLSVDTEDASCLALACRFCYVANRLNWFTVVVPVLLFKTFVRIADQKTSFYVDVTRGGKIRTAGDIYELYRTLHIRPLPTTVQLTQSPLIKCCNFALTTTKMWLKRYPPDKRSIALIGLIMVRNIFLTACDTLEQLEIQLFRALDRLPSSLKYEVAILQNGIHQLIWSN
ncbi:hypothetical protein TRICI_000637 [Trichomonascus ciferrii]|uniref:F-box domain-containing protein n=1 Tax=Trichomonascus ciferrii TaxID=44093 RepID=A0A642VD01_9ASCO|nr:hypothetical protein TRICI_000637 [Trichomonascus ciferrii]